jgi:hypothetical protein
LAITKSSGAIPERQNRECHARFSHFATGSKRQLRELKDKLDQVKGPKRQAPIRREIKELDKAIKGHEKEIGQKWPEGPPGK